MDSLRGKETLQEIAHKLVQEKFKAQSAEGPREKTIFALGSPCSVSCFGMSIGLKKIINNN